VTIKFKLRDTKTQSSFTFFYYYFYYSLSYIVSSLHMNQDREVDSGPKTVLQMQ